MAIGTKKKEKSKGPKAYEVVIGALLSVILGLLLGVVYLIVQPVEEVDEMPPEEARDRRTVYFVEGATGSAGQYNWRSKLAALEAGRSGTIELVEQELNQWAALQFPDLDEEGEEDGFAWIAPRSINFRVYDGLLQIASEMELNVMGVGRKTMAQAHGNFVRKEGRFVFQPEWVSLGGFELSHERATALILEKVFPAFEGAEDLREGWAQLSRVAIEEDSLILEIP